ncbi:MAG: excinuclease ABC subunit UvrC [Cryomorphaceae bacterium]|nr:excinuclease ABC subunit UvrC [Cryomorphaceae bacterium]
METKPHIKSYLKTISDSPGIYQYYDKDGHLLYIGKAKNLRKRVSSYFNKNHDNRRIEIMVRRIDRIETVVTETEFDALLLENNLIKSQQPRYNINLKDDKSYPWICIRNERFPRVYSTRKKYKDGSEYFGPYASKHVHKTILGLIRQIYPLRTCKLNLSEDNIDKGKYKVCLEYHIGNCKGPCEAYQSEADYNRDIAAVRHLLKGHLNEVKRTLQELMKEQAESLQFEEAQKTKEKLEHLQSYQSRSVVVNMDLRDVDVFTAITDATHGYVNFLKIIDGAVVQARSMEFKRKLDENEEALLEIAIPEMRQLYRTEAPEIILSHALDIEIPGVKLTVPQRGDKKKLVELSLKNARYHRLERLKNMQSVDPERHVKRLMTQMKQDLRLAEEPRHAECFDNSNLHGTNAVAACVVFKNGKPSKKDYRHFNIKTVEGPDDFASMAEVVFRRYKRMLEEGHPLPQLIVVDGGKGQLSAALDSLDKLGLRGKIAIIGIAKRLEEIYYPNDPVPLYLDKKSETLKVIQQMRDEAHRFGITHHRNKRSKSTFKSALEDIPGIGPESIKILLKHYGAVKGVQSAPKEDVIALLGPAKAEKILEYFKNTEKI